MSEENYQMLHEILLKLSPVSFREWIEYKESRSREENIACLVARINLAVDEVHNKVDQIIGILKVD